MRDSYTLPIRAFYPEATMVKRNPFRPSYIVSYGDKKRTKKTCWHHDTFDLIHQTHDGKHTFVSVLEVSSKVDIVIIPIRSLNSDLHRLYLLTGNLTLRSEDMTKRPELIMRGGEYALLYVPTQQSGCLVFEKGRHLLVSIAIEQRWQKRQPMEGFQRPSGCKASPLYVIDLVMRILITGLVSLPPTQGMALDPVIDHFAMELDTRHRWRYVAESPAPPPQSLLEAIIRGIRQEIEAQRYPSVSKLSTDLACSRQRMHQHFKAQRNQSIKAYITEQVMREAWRLLCEMQLSPAAVAYRLGYSEHSSFNHQFKRYYSISPSEARETRTIDPPAPRSRIP